MKMAVSVPKRKSGQPKKPKPREFGLHQTVFSKVLNRIPTAVLLILLLFLWSSSSTIISGKFIHVCVSSRKLGNLYCLSAGAQPSFEIPIPLISNSSLSSGSNGGGDFKEIVEAYAIDNAGSNSSAESVEKDRTDFEAQSSFSSTSNDGQDHKKETAEAYYSSDNAGSISSAESIAENRTDFKAQPSLNYSSNGSEDHYKEIVEASANHDGGSDSSTGSVEEKQTDFEAHSRLSSSSNGGQDLNKEIAEAFSGYNGGSNSTESVEENRQDFRVQSSLNSSSNGGQDYKKQIVQAPASNNGGWNRADFEVKSHQKNNIGDTPVNSNVEEIDDEDETAKAMAAIEEQLQEHRSWMWTTAGDTPATECSVRGIYVYELPPKFNHDLVAQCGDMVPWMNFCNFFRNEALGDPIPNLGNRWFQTHQYSLEPIFHSRVLKHRCRVYKETEAKLFYVPYYGGLDILRWHFKNNVSTAIKDSLGFELLQWLGSQRPWIRSSGKDHVFVLGKISWDFRRNSSDESAWGTRFLELDQMQNPIKLLIERQPWHQNDIGIPHPTFFHPHSDDDIFDWQRKIIRSERKTLVAFAGAARPEASDNIRSILIKHCSSSSSPETGNCRHLDCNSGDCENPSTVMELFRRSEFCLQPPGDSPTRKSVFDSLISGCIPVFFDRFTAYYQYPWHLPEDHSKYSVFIDKKELRKTEENLVKKLMGISEKKREEMRSYIVYELVPGLVYADSNNELRTFQDAFDIAINNLLHRVSKL